MTRQFALCLGLMLACAPPSAKDGACTSDCSAESDENASSPHAGHMMTGSSDAVDAGSSDSCLLRTALLDGKTDLTTSADWAPHDDYALAGAIDELRLLRIDTGFDSGQPSIKTLVTYRGQTGRPAAWWSPDGTLALSAAHDLRLLEVGRDPPTLKELARYTPDEDPLYHVAWSPEGGHALITGTDVRLIAIDKTKGTLRELAAFREHVGRVFMTAWSPDGKYAITGGEDHTVRLLAVDALTASLTEIASFDAQEMVTVVSWQPRGNGALIGTWEGDSELKLLKIDTTHARITEGQQIASHEVNARAIKWTPDGLHAIWAGHNGTPRLCMLQDDQSTVRALTVLPSDASGVHELSWSPKGEWFLAAASQRDRITLVDARACIASH